LKISELHSYPTVNSQIIMPLRMWNICRRGVCRFYRDVHRTSDRRDTDLSGDSLR
jgi:hypothetical protein